MINIISKYSRNRFLIALAALVSLSLVITSFGGRKPRIKTLFVPNAAISLPLSPANTLIAFDIHSVLVAKNKLSMGWNLFKNVGAIKFAHHEAVKKHIKSVDGATAAPEDYFLPLIDRIPEIEPYIPGFLNVVNAHEPIPGMPHLIERLSDKKGYNLYILSNIGQAAYYGWQSVKNPNLKAQGLKDRYPDIFRHFTGIKVASKKPSSSAYTNFIDTFAKPDYNNKSPVIVFIDDRLDNIHAAVAQGFVGIWFKNPHQLETDLMRLGIL